MNNLITKFLILFCSFFIMSSVIAKQDINIFSESFGDKSNPAILLNGGAGSQVIIWSQEFCNKLANKGYFVIRYDSRDAGLSSAVNYDKNPYNALDLAKDSVKVLKKYNIKKAHYVGISMGGQVAQFVGAYLPSYAISLTLINSSSDLTVPLNAYNGKFEKDGLSPPTREWMKIASKNFDFSKMKFEEKVEHYVMIWRGIEGNPKDFDEDYYRKQAHEYFTRSKLHNSSLNHARSMMASKDLHDKAFGLITAPTLIIHGDIDPIFPLDHGIDLNKKIKNSKLVVIKGLAHALSPKYVDIMIENIDHFIKQK